MSNENCLAGLRCPRCGNEDRLLIGCKVMADVTDGGADVFGDMEWDAGSPAACPACDQAGKLSDFYHSPELPPDPEGMNDNRAAWAADALTCFRTATGTDAEDAVCDLLTDLMHWCDRNGQDFGHELTRAEDHYAAETLGDDSPN